LPDRRRLLSLLFLSLLVVSSARGAEPKTAARPASLSRKIESILRASEARRGHWGIEVVRLRDGKVLYSRQAEQLFLPASNMKLFTTAAAIEKLGPDFRFRTTVEAAVPPDAAGRVTDLFLVGRGDPFMGNRVLPDEPRPANAPPPDAVLQAFADQLVSKGVRGITGKLIADDTYFVFEPFSRGWEEDDLVYGYAAPVTALAFNDNALLLRLAPGAAVGDMARIEIQPFSEFYALDNRLVTVPGNVPHRIRIVRNPGSRQLMIWGEIQIDAEPDEDSVSVEDPSRWAGEILRKALKERGIRVGGSVEVRRISPAEASAQDFAPSTTPRVVLAERLSAPLSEDIKIINKFSHNLHVEMLLRTLGKELNAQGRSKAGIEVLENFVKDIGIEEDEAVFADGSGLSRHSLIAPRATIKLLKFMSKSPRFPAFLDSLPIAGEDGTLDDRFVRTSARGRIRAKTGTLEHVNALAGYMDMPSGERLAFSVMGNEHPMRAYQGKRVVDRITVTIFEHFGGRRKAKRL
jgi:D-alanyl-D-alanine carboxypeptidase/D-alanyl-D-alanine-endopeptidase (penicillin-binding protein 4)